MRLSPEQYSGSLLCPRCGQDENGFTYQICAEGRHSHKESCARYNYGFLCKPCLIIVFGEEE